MPASWPQAAPVTGALRSAGRGNTMIVSHGDQEFVLRHYVRGGLPGRIVRDSYIWRGERQTRPFSEWYLLAKLVRMGLPVPHPAAARYVRSGLIYRADLLTVRIPGIRSLADRISEAPGSPVFWTGLGRGIRKFHDAGVFHADLNAYNVQVDRLDRLFLLDFDRGIIHLKKKRDSIIPFTSGRKTGTSCWRATSTNRDRHKHRAVNPAGS